MLLPTNDFLLSCFIVDILFFKLNLHSITFGLRWREKKCNIIIYYVPQCSYSGMSTWIPFSVSFRSWRSSLRSSIFSYIDRNQLNISTPALVNVVMNHAWATLLRQFNVLVSILTSNVSICSFSDTVMCFSLARASVSCCLSRMIVVACSLISRSRTILCSTRSTQYTVFIVINFG